ncbi:MAG: FAD-dependent thymidylate synthase [Oscillospiraceae bacterium]|nr:FAD-dependent thymidylate synthase [Oscillospiraceae bacterium]
MTHQSVAKIISWNADLEAVCASAAKMSTTLGNASEIFKATRSSGNSTELIRKVLRSGHKSVIEHAVFSIAFQDVSVFVEQFLIECRLASFTVKSRRYVDFGGQGYLTPDDLHGESLDCYRSYMDTLFDGYRTLLELGVPKEDARFLLPYAFCSNFYCTLNARELGNLLSAIRYGRGKGIPELQELARQLEQQLAEIFPALLSELTKETDETVSADALVWFAPGDAIRPIPTEEVGQVRLLQQPAQPMEMLRFAHTAAHPHSTEELNLQELIASDRPRELEHLNYSFSVSNLTLSGLTHLVRHRMQSISIPSLCCVDHTRCIVPETVQQSPEALECYTRTLAQVSKKLAQVREDASLRKYGYYFALSGNVVDVMTTMNARELMLLLRLRTCNRAQWEIRKVAEEMLALLRESFPELFQLYGPTCVLTGICPEGRLTCGHKDEIQKKYRG